MVSRPFTIHYVLCGSNNSPTDVGAWQILETEGYRLYENPNPMGRLTMVHRFAGFANNEFRLKVLSQGFDCFPEAYVTPGDFQAVRRFWATRRCCRTLKTR
jgi:hypothetical protein